VNPRSDEEYRALRATIRERGTARIWVFFVGLTMWAVSIIATLVAAVPPAAMLIPLLALAATFEAVLALHVGVERVGRYLMVFHDDEWERTAGAFGKPSGAIAVDPLFTVYFLLAALLTLVPTLALGPRPVEFGGLGLGEAAFFARVIAARVTCGRQRAVDAARFQELKKQ